MILGFVMLVVGCIWFMVVAFGQGFWWGIGTLLIQPVWVVFLVKFWDKARSSFITECVGGALLVIGVFAAGMGAVFG